MDECPFSSIPEYLSKQKFPKDTIKKAQVTHIWTQEVAVSLHVAKASKIMYVVNEMEDMIGKVDAVLLARDDAENHLKMSRPFLLAGLPIFIDKPLAYSLKEAKEILDLQQFENQIFTCSSLRYAKEFQLTEAKKKSQEK